MTESEAIQEYDVLVLGGGTGGTAAARAAAESGARVAMFNQDELGGLCILRGCMPTKTLLHAAHLAHEAAHHHTPGIGHGELSIDIPAVLANKDAKVERFKRAKIRGIESSNYDVILERACFVGPDLVEAGGQRYRFTRGAVIATGSVVSKPPIPGLDQVPFLTSDDLMRSEELPGSAIVIGSGAIGLELGQFLARMGRPVSLVSRRPVFQDVDPKIVEEFHQAMLAEPDFTPYSGVPPQAVRMDGEDVVLTVRVGDEDQEIRAAALVLATGRRAALDGLSLEQVDVRVERGRVVCGDDMQTTNPRVFVAGDASGDRQLLHVANWEGKAAGLGAAGVPGDHAVEQRLHMLAVFTDPPLATVGMNEVEARAAGHDPVVARERMPETGRAITMDVQAGAMVLVAERSTGEILGAQMLAPRADDIIHTISAVMYYRGTAAQMLEMPWYHPTLTEVLLSLARGIESQRG